MKNLGVFLIAAALIFEPFAAMAKHKTRHGRHGVSQQDRSQQDRARFDHSGTRGRMGLGANPRHPEGPGNFSSPR